MCEIQFIYGLEKSLTDEDLKVFKTLMVEGGRNNNHAHGYIQANKDGVKTFKSIPLNEVLDTLNLRKTRFLIGHNRYSTQGNKTDNRNNHPFIDDGLYWVHNGVIDNDDYLFNLYDIKRDVDTDSYIIGKLVNYYKADGKTITDALTEALNEIVGSISSFLYDEKEGRLFYFKNDETNFIFRLYKTKDNTLIIGSTKEANITKALNKDCFGFSVLNEDYKKLSSFKPEGGIIYEIGKNGIKEVGEFSPEYCGDYDDEYEEEDLEEYKQALKHQGYTKEEVKSLLVREEDDYKYRADEYEKYRRNYLKDCW